MALYEGMFLLDNDTVRAGWAGAKAAVTDLIAKHGGQVVTARRWDERPLTYPIRGRHRATYLLVHFEMLGDAIPQFHRDLEIKDDVLRYLQLRVAAVPELERQLAEAEGADDFVVPEPPKDTPPPIAPELFSEREERRERRPRDQERSNDGDEDSGDGEDQDEDSEEEAPALATGGKGKKED
jgi:ribosomal protein S6